MLSLALMMAIAAARPARPAEDGLLNGFVNPPDSAKPHTWWHWMNGNVTKEGITADLEAMKRVGVGGAQIFNVHCEIPAGKVKFMSDDWREMIKHAVKEADRLGLELCMHNCAGWSSSGGPWIKPQYAMQIVTFTEKQVSGPSNFSGTVKRPKTNLGCYRDIALLAFKTPANQMKIDMIQGKAAFERAGNLPLSSDRTDDPERVIRSKETLNITDRVDTDGILTWDVPEGDWTILRIGYTPTGKTNHPAPREGTGPECDKLSREAAEIHFNGMIQKVLDDIGPLAGRSLKNILIDSYEVGSQNWSPKFREEFKARRGYDPMDYLPVFTGRVVDSPEISERFLWDLRLTVAELFADNYYGYLAKLCRDKGLVFSIEAYGNGTFDDIACGGRADIPMGEFWTGGGAINTCKLASSSSHLYGRKITGAEAFTSVPELGGKWQNDPYSLKALGDLVFCNGVNRFIFHRYAMQPWLDRFPGMTMGQWGFNFDRTNTWWEQGAAWLKYLSRCQYLLQQGLFVADACYFCGEGGPRDFRVGNPPLQKGYDYDGCNAEIIMTRMSVKDGRLVLPDGMSYAMLVLPPSDNYMTPGLLRKIIEFVKDGATVVGPKPDRSPSLRDFPKCDEQVRTLADELWGECDGKTVKERAFGKGSVIWNRPLKNIFSDMGLQPDFEYRGSNARFAYIHRKTESAEIYFISNQRDVFTEAECVFRVSGKIPEFWYPDTGKTEEAVVYKEEDGRTSVPVRLGPAGSVFVVFRQKNAGTDHVVSVSFSGEKEQEMPEQELEIKRAVYEAIDGAGSMDVTSKLKRMVRDGELSIEATNAAMGSDPTPMHVKRLRVEYTVNGSPGEKTAQENEILEILDLRKSSQGPVFRLARAVSGKTELEAWKPGTYEMKTASGRALKAEVKKIPEPVEVKGAWDMKFPLNWGAPEKVKFEKLISWAEHKDEGVKYFSGTAVYTKEIDVPAGMTGKNISLYLDLGVVKNIAEVKVNGKNLGILWKPPFIAEITDVVKPGKNKIEVRVTNLWPNRVIGDEQLPEDRQWSGLQLKKWPQWLLDGKPSPTGRLTFYTWKHYNKDSPLLESGLLGPVRIVTALRCIPDGAEK